MSEILDGALVYKDILVRYIQYNKEFKYCHSASSLSYYLRNIAVQIQKIGDNHDVKTQRRKVEDNTNK